MKKYIYLKLYKHFQKKKEKYQSKTIYYLQKYLENK